MMNLDEICNLLYRNEKFAITTHEAPDGDGLGAEYALAASLQDAGKDAVILNSDQAADKYSFFDKRSLLNYLDDAKDIPRDIGERWLIVLDTEPTNIGWLGQYLPSLAKGTIVIDHHEQKSGVELHGWLVPEASSTCELIYRVLENMCWNITRDVAISLYTGIVYDTGSFIYPKTQARTFRIAESLVGSGAIPNEIYTELFESKSTGALMLQSLVMSTMTLHNNDSIAVQVMPRETLIASGADYDESQEIVNIPLQCMKVRVSVFFKETEYGQRRCSMRSKGEVDCSEIAHSLGGGGHKTAAGFRFDESFADIQEKVLAAIIDSFS